jgi:hypothetical protein
VVARTPVGTTRRIDVVGVTTTPYRGGFERLRESRVCASAGLLKGSG